MIQNIQFLRFLAAFGVIFLHALQQLKKNGNEAVQNRFVELGASGVDIFFVISGFIMCYISANRNDTRKDFFLRRWLRIAPPYWVVNIAMLIVLIVAPTVLETALVNWPHFIASNFFIPWPHPLRGEALPLYQPGWTLNYEFIFYSMFAVFLPLKLPAKTVGLALVFFTVVILGKILPFDNVFLTFVARPLWFEFIFGMIIANIYFSGLRVSKSSAVCLIAGGILFLFLSSVFWPIGRTSELRFLAWGAPAAAIVAGGLFLEREGHYVRSRFIAHLGDSSYAVYITHMFVITAVGAIWGLLKLKNMFHDSIFLSVLVVLCFLGGSIFHLYVELPVVNLFRKLLSSRRIIGR